MDEKANAKKMLSWSSDSDDDDENEDETKDHELKTIKHDVITHRRRTAPINVVNEPQLLNRKVDSSRITTKYLRVNNRIFVFGSSRFNKRMIILDVY